MNISFNNPYIRGGGLLLVVVGLILLGPHISRDRAKEVSAVKQPAVAIPQAPIKQQGNTNHSVTGPKAPVGAPDRSEKESEGVWGEVNHRLNKVFAGEAK